MTEELKDKLDAQETIEERRQRYDEKYPEYASDLIQEESEHADHRRYMLEMVEDVKAEAELHLHAKPQPFWTQQGRHKKGGRGKY